MSAPVPHRLHGFSRLVLVVSDESFEDVRTDHSFELRAVEGGAEVWRSSVLHAPGGTCESGERYLGSLGTRQVVELLEQIRRTGIYEALPTLDVVQGSADPQATPTVTMRLEGASSERDVLAEVPADRQVARSLVQVVREAVEDAQERSLTVAG